MSIPSINGASRVSTSMADTPAPTVIAANRQSNASANVVEIDEATQQPKPPRFPWLSRLSQQLESAAQQRPAFPAAPVLGDHIDKSA
jgi:hypothetical protein